MIVVDTSVWVDAFRGVSNPAAAWLEQHIGGNLALTDSILCEVLQGIRDEKQYRQVRSNLLHFAIFDTGGASLAIASAENYRSLRKRGVTVRGTIDCSIATFCIREGHALLHHDRDYDPFEKFLELKVIRP
jgi:predicted nucleic acid-binding protein